MSYDDCPHGLGDPSWCGLCKHGPRNDALTVSRQRSAQRPRIPLTARTRDGRWGQLGVDPRYRGTGVSADVYERGYAPSVQDRRFSMKALRRDEYHPVARFQRGAPGQPGPCVPESRPGPGTKKRPR